MSWADAFAQAGAGDLTLALICVLCIFAAGAIAGHASRQRDDEPDFNDAGDTHAHLPPLHKMRTADAARIERESREALAHREIVRQQRVRAGSNVTPLKPSYDSRRDRQHG